MSCWLVMSVPAATGERRRPHGDLSSGILLGVPLTHVPGQHLDMGKSPCAIALCVALSGMCALSAGLGFPEPGCLPGPSDVAWLPLVTCVQENCVVFALPEGCCLLVPLQRLPLAAWRPPSPHLKPCHASHRDPSPSRNPHLPGSRS